MEHQDPAFVVAIAMGAGVAAQLVARHLRIPGIVLLFATGIALGPDGVGWIDPRALGDGLFGLVGIGVAIILFEGGLQLELRRLRREGGAIQMLVTVGATITAAGGMLAARLIMQWPWPQAVLFGTLVIVTGPTVISPLLRLVRVRPRLATVLEAEGVLIDPIGAIIAAVTLNMILPTAESGLASGLAGLGLRLAFGAGAGLVFGLVLGGMLRLPSLLPPSLANIFSLGTVLLLYEGCEHVLSESGVLAVTVAGVVVANLESRLSEELREFKEHLTVGLIALLFVLLAADVRMADVIQLGVPGLLTVGALVVFVRPACVMVSTLRSGLSPQEIAFVSWLGPRGIVAAAIASITAAHMEARGMPGGTELRALVFLTIALTVVVLGGLAPLVARILGVRQPGRDAVVILGAEELGRALGEVLRVGGARVVMADRNPEHIHAAQEAGFAVVYGNALDEYTLARTRPEQAKFTIGLTANDEVNSLFARETRERFGVPETLVAISRGERTVTPRLLERQDTQVLFDRPKDVERWNVRLRHNLVRTAQFQFVGLPEPDGEGEKEPDGEAALKRPLAGQDAYLMLAVQRGKDCRPMAMELEPKLEDVATVLIHIDEDADAVASLHDLGWQPFSEPEPESHAEADVVETPA